MTKENRFQIIKDTREKKGHGWWYDENAYCSGTTVAKVDIGDYAIEGMEHVLCIERKESVSEFAGNCSEKRFHAELKKMATFPFAFLIFEFSWSDIENEGRYFHYNNGNDRKMDNYYDTIQLLSIHTMNKYNPIKVELENIDITIPDIVHELKNHTDHPLKNYIKEKSI